LGRGRVVCCPRSAFATKTQASKDGETLRRNGESSEAPHVHQKRMAKTTAMVEEDLRRELHAVREELSQLKRALEELQNLQQPQKSAKSPYQWLQMFYPKRLLDSFKAQASPQLEKNFNWLVKVQLAKDRSKTKVRIARFRWGSSQNIRAAHYSLHRESIHQCAANQRFGRLFLLVVVVVAWWTSLSLRRLFLRFQHLRNTLWCWLMDWVATSHS